MKYVAAAEKLKKVQLRALSKELCCLLTEAFS